MKISRIKIDKLFEIFDYDISLENNENLLIITGPNGFGKTMLLNIVFNLFNRKFLFFQKLVFEKISIWLDNKKSIIILKKTANDKQLIEFSFFNEDKEIGSYEYSDELEAEVLKNLSRYLPLIRVDENLWRDRRNDRVISTETLINEYADQLPEELGETMLGIRKPEINKILDSIKVHLIKEQRLFRKIQNAERGYREEKDQAIMVETIQTYASKLQQLIAQSSQQSLKVSQQLDSSYPDRLLHEKNKLSKAEYENRFEKLNEKQEKLAKNGLYERKQQFLGYSQDDSKALLVYLNDFEQKLGVFDSLLDKLELFTGILNERRFTFKSIQIDREKGFYFKTSKGKELELNQLSSGEQHEVVLLYELIFNASSNVIVLIDEPEISLHITWQKEFLKDLLKIVKIQNIQVLIATHSPSIINDRWDLVYNLEKTEAP